jgi:hypothetical protein
MLRALDPALNIQVICRIAGKTGGGSGSFLFCTHDRHLMLKTINTNEKVTLLEDLVPVMKERRSLLVRVYMLSVGI